MSSILVADDDIDIREVSKRQLEKSGYHVTAVEDGEQALMAINEGHSPDLIVTDVMMPQLNGFHFCKALKEKPSTQNIPIIVISGYTQLEESLRNLEVDDFVCKPFRMEQLKNKIAKYLP